jgi:cell division cycle 2-like
LETKEIVALKKIKMNHEEGFPTTSLRELNILLSLGHPNIVEVREVVVGRTDQQLSSHILHESLFPLV